MRIAVVGHVEWCEFAPVERLPGPGEIVSSPGSFELAAGGGAVTAVQIARLMGGCLFFTALGDDELGRRAAEQLADLGVTLAVAWRDEPQRKAFVHLEASGERTITTIGERLAPRADDGLPWEALGEADAAYVTAGDEDAIRTARQAGALVATTRVGDPLFRSDVQLDALVLSARDSGETGKAEKLEPKPRTVIRTEGSRGGSFETAHSRHRWEGSPLPGPLADAYGSGDSFAGGLTAGLALRMRVADAVELGARCGAACATGRGPYEGQLSEAP
jgi:ribokinase